jgi:hypothetical protein
MDLTKLSEVPQLLAGCGTEGVCRQSGRPRIRCRLGRAGIAKAVGTPHSRHIASYMPPIECPHLMITTIQVSPTTRERLAALKSSPRETYDELLSKLLALVPRGDDEGTYTDAFRVGLLNARLDIRSGRTTSHDQVKKRLGL